MPTCPICLEECSPASSRTLQCSHVFHESCITQWFRSGNTCPVCRERVPLVDAPDFTHEDSSYPQHLEHVGLIIVNMRQQGRVRRPVPTTRCPQTYSVEELRRIFDGLYTMHTDTSQDNDQATQLLVENARDIFRNIGFRL